MRTGKRAFVLAVLITFLMGLGTPPPAAGAELTQLGDPVFVGAGDITNCHSKYDEATASLLDIIPGTVFTLGDNAYPDGSADQFQNCYDPTWGRHKSRTMPVPGNHDYHTNGAAGYYGYFGTVASPQDNGCSSDCKGYYSYDLGTWHIVALNSEIDVSAGSPQEQWLRADLAAHPAACTLAYWHEPLFNSGKHGNARSVQPLWQALYERGVDIVLNGHDHNYQRFAPQDPNGNADPKGIREFVVGTGGAGLYSFISSQPNTEARDDQTFGVLKLTLHAASYDWEFIPIAGQTFTDSGSAECVTDGTVPGITVTPSLTPTLVPSSTPAVSTPTPISTGTPAKSSSPVSFFEWLWNLLFGK